MTHVKLWYLIQKFLTLILSGSSSISFAICATSELVGYPLIENFLSRIDLWASVKELPPQKTPGFPGITSQADL